MLVVEKMKTRVDSSFDSGVCEVEIVWFGYMAANLRRRRFKPCSKKTAEKMTGLGKLCQYRD